MIRRDLLILVLSACAVSASAGCSHATPPATASAAHASDPRDLAWLNELVKALETGTATREQVVAFLGTDAGPSPTNEGGRVVRPRSALLASATVYPLPHIEIKVAMDLAFTPGAMPTLDALAHRLGSFDPVPRAPDDFGSGEKFVHYSQRADTKTEVRIFAELAHDAGRRVAKLHIDVEAL